MENVAIMKSDNNSEINKLKRIINKLITKQDLTDEEKRDVKWITDSYSNEKQ